MHLTLLSLYKVNHKLLSDLPLLHVIYKHFSLLARFSILVHWLGEGSECLSPDYTTKSWCKHR